MDAYKKKTLRETGRPADLKFVPPPHSRLRVAPIGAILIPHGGGATPNRVPHGTNDTTVLVLCAWGARGAKNVFASRPSPLRASCLGVVAVVTGGDPRFLLRRFMATLETENPRAHFVVVGPGGSWH
ncbi:hypothetical protein L596_020453 [Steinernema carpocapsae]|uniref:Uncharacterized protein n=1 Tax=Steinernema carpocapsae TaxID=34508 RepID=A0A4U5MU89_STECR|nr:hypothetical protein L596_020453 [Steinernema carpocapsae]